MEDPEDPESPPRARSARHPASGAVLQEAIERLGMPILASADPEEAHAHLEEQRKAMHAEAQELARAKLDYELNVREYNGAQLRTPRHEGPSRIKEVRARGKALNAEIGREGRPRVGSTPGLSAANRPKYSSPAKALRAAEAVIADLANLSGDALKKIGRAHV